MQYYDNNLAIVEDDNLF